jgi:nucleoid-associated protein YgaU
VEPGDNLWLIARNQLALATERNPRSLRNSEVAAYWVRVVAANRSHLRSKNPDLIYPGESVRLPPIPNSAGS